MSGFSTLGACSNCGGPAQVPTDWVGSQPPRPVCSQCSYESTNVVPVIEMRPPEPIEPIEP